MKKIVVILFTLLWLIPAAQAVPALRGKFQYKQPDGTVIMLELHGDEHYQVFIPVIAVVYRDLSEASAADDAAHRGIAEDRREGDRRV